ncbi:MAG: hypothetical protein JJU37_04100 [Balneolaceae bacterium]|nr:hypothetical protein [Balneolaceae bacterium]
MKKKYSSILILIIFLSSCSQLTDTDDTTHKKELFLHSPLVYETNYFNLIDRLKREMSYLEDYLKLNVKDFEGKLSMNQIDDKYSSFTVSTKNEPVIFEFKWINHKDYEVKITGESVFEIFVNLEKKQSVSIKENEKVVFDYSLKKEQGWSQESGSLSREDIKSIYPTLVQSYIPISTAIMDYKFMPEYIKSSVSGIDWLESSVVNGNIKECANNYTEHSILFICSGHLYSVFNTAGTNYSCCWNAIASVNAACNNAYCIGCCSDFCHVECLFLGRYCWCEAYGQACGPCDGTPGHPDC